MMAQHFLPISFRIFATLLAAGISVHGEDETEPFPPGARPPDRSLYEKGRFVYQQNCLVCHGERGNGKGELAEQLSPKPRDFRYGMFKYRSTPWGKLPTDDDLLRTIREGRSGTAMGMFAHLREGDLRAVAEYIKFFSRKWKKPEYYAEPLPEPQLPGWFSDAAEAGKRAEAGQKIFATTCTPCHGTEADGKGPASTGLKDIAGNPVTPADLRQPNLRSGKELTDVFRVLSTGLNGTPMVSFAETLNEEQRWEVVTYIARLREKHAGKEEPHP